MSGQGNPRRWRRRASVVLVLLAIGAACGYETRVGVDERGRRLELRQGIVWLWEPFPEYPRRPEGLASVRTDRWFIFGLYRTAQEHAWTNNKSHPGARSMTVEQWHDRWDGLGAAYKRHKATFPSYRGGNDASPPRVEANPPATEAEVAEVERKLGIVLPTSFRRVLTAYSSAVDIAWELPEGVKAPPPVHRLYGGDLQWSLQALVELEETRLRWTQGDDEVPPTYGDPNDPYDAVWHNKLAFYELPNGDMFAIELGLPDQQPVVFLSHDGADEHGYWLGADFEDFVDRFTRLGCPNPEEFALFTTGSRSLLQPDGENGRRWRAWLGIDGG